MIDYLEYFAVFSGILYLILISQVIRWGWIFGIMSAAAYTFICFNAALYFQSVLQLIYVFTGLWGFMRWIDTTKTHEKTTTQLSVKQNILIFLATFVFAIVAFYFLSFTNQKSALLDSFVSVFSILATAMTVFRLIENWYYWWAINSLAIVLFYQQNLKTTVFLSVVYLILSIYGYVQWRKKLVRS